MTSKRPYTGLHMPGGSQIPRIGDREAQARLAFVQELEGLTRALFLRAAGEWITGDNPASENEYAELARTCQTAAKAYFEGLGLVQFAKPDSAETTE